MNLQTKTISDQSEWNTALSALPYAHVLQTWEWGDFKQATTGWQPTRIAYMHDGATVGMAQLLTRQEGPLKVMYIPKGPALDYANADLRQAVLDHLKQYANDNGAIFIKMDPDVVIATGVPGEQDAAPNPLGQTIQQEWEAAGLRFSEEQIQFRNSLVIDLTPPEDDIMMDMKSKTRYNIRYAGRKDIKVREGGPEDIELLYELYVETAERGGFLIRPLDYYRRAWIDFMEAGLAKAFIAEYEGEPLAHVIIFAFGDTAWYFYGASTDKERKRMPTYALQWEAMRWAKSQGMTRYDMWGAPDDFDDPDDALAGVFRFKEGFGGTVERRIGAWDYVASPALYAGYTRMMPAVLNMMRTFGRKQETT